MIPILGVCGASNSGKTTLLCGVISQFRDQGLKVGALKHHGHAQPLPPEDPEKDTSRLLAAGATRAVLVHAGGVRLLAGPAEAQAAPQDLAVRLLSDLDLVLVEGYKGADLDKIEVVAPGKKPLLPPGGRLLALARRGGAGQEEGLPVLDADQPAAVAAFMAQHLRGQAQEAPLAPVRLLVDGQEVEIKPFVARILDNTLRGLVAALQTEGRPAGRIEVLLG